MHLHVAVKKKRPAREERINYDEIDMLLFRAKKKKREKNCLLSAWDKSAIQVC